MSSPLSLASPHPVAAPVPVTVLDLLDRARASLFMSARSDSVTQRYIDAHLSALRSAAALLAARTRPSRRSRPRSVWEMLPVIAPELTEWALFFASSGRRRAALERGSYVITLREADDLLRQAETFLELVQTCLGLPTAQPLPEFAASVSPAPRLQD
jgi:hypothetical protein